MAITMRWRLYRSATAPPIWRKQEDGIRLANPTSPSRRRRSGETVNQPALGHGLHPGADQRDELPAHEDPVVPVPQGP